MSTSILTKDNFLQFAAKNYNNIACTKIKDLLKDIKIIHIAKKYVYVHTKGKPLNTRRVLNIIITCNNVFGSRCTIRLFFYLFDKIHYNILISFFEFLSIMDYDIPELINIKTKPDDQVTELLNQI